MSLSPEFVTLSMFGLLFALIFLRIPIAFALAIAVVPVLFLEERLTPDLLLQRMMYSYNSFILLAVPFFLLAANLMNSSGITTRLIRLSKALAGFLPGGLGHVNVVVSMFFAGISGSSNADAAGIGSVLIPAMIKEKYDRYFSVAVTACSSVMGVIIPPSINMVVWAGIMNISVGGLFLAGFVPGILIAFFQMGLVSAFAWKRGYPKESRLDLREVVASLNSASLACLTPLIIIGGIIAGFVTPTEASLLAVVYSLFLGMVVYRSINLPQFYDILIQTAKLAALPLFAVGTASIYGWVLAYYRIPAFLVDSIGFITTSPVIMLFIIVFLFLLVGTFMDAIPAIVILGPLLKPLAMHAGIHPLHFAIVGVISISFGLITPPYGLCLLISSEIAGINCTQAIKEVGVFLLVMFLVLALVVIFPELSLFIPRQFMPKIM